MTAVQRIGLSHSLIDASALCTAVLSVTASFHGCDNNYDYRTLSSSQLAQPRIGCDVIRAA